MNLTSFNHLAVSTFCLPENREKAAASIASFPLFTMESGQDLPAETIATLRESNLPELMPFDGIRLYDRMDDGSRVNEWLLIINREENGIQANAFCYSVQNKLTGKKQVSPFSRGVSIIVHNTLDAKRAFFADGKPVKQDEFNDPKSLDLYDNAARHVLFSFFASLLNPHLHLATVRPDKQGKSVEWMRQRTHFVFIHKSHQANQVGFLGKADISEKQIQRMAHSRRAHFRVLRHPKYKNKIGQIIHVRSCWVGPKEWQGNSGQIYRIVDPFRVDAGAVR